MSKHDAQQSVSDLVRAVQRNRLCEASGQYGPWREPLACGYKLGHRGPHSWSSLPTWVEGVAVSEVGSRPHPETGTVPEDFAAGKPG